jgi:large conductance mechanosensitive channel
METFMQGQRREPRFPQNKSGVIRFGAAGAVLAYGNFLTVALNFLIIAFVLVVAIQGVNKMKKKEEEKPVEPSASEKLLAEIRDLLARKA